MASPLLFTAIVGQEQMRRSLVLNAINPAIGGVLIRGEKGTAKSTAVRALAALLPELRVVVGCRFGCDPAQVEQWCDECQLRQERGEELTAEKRRMRVVELPINASEDRVVGSIDIEAAIKRGEKEFEPGVLAEANRNILYVDEVNLLDDHIVDVLLDAAAMGRNTVEREGVSISHPSRFILVGTMNPEEGDLRPQLLDRFGLCVDVLGMRTIEDRVAVMQRDMRAQLADGAVGDIATEAQLADTIRRARELEHRVGMSRWLRTFIAAVCVDAGTAGHRADIVVTRTARALTALRVAQSPSSDLECTPEDVIAAASLALAHRRTERDSRGSDSAERVAEQARERLQQMEPEPQEASPVSSVEGDPSDDGEGEEGETDSSAQSDGGTATDSGDAGGTAVDLGDVFNVRKIALPRERVSRTQSGKRSQSRSQDRRGRYVGSTQSEHPTDVALDATLRAAAPHQLRRRDETPDSPTALRLERQDLRQKVRRRRTGTLIVFVVDASASMDAEQRMQATKGAILSLLRDAYIRRDKVALVVFSGRVARVALQPTSSIDLAEQRLQRLSVGGTTPLTQGLVAGLKLVRTERLRDPTVLPLMVLISDGRGNISMFGEEPVTEAQRIATQIGAEHVRVLVIDSARDSTSALLPRIPGLAQIPGGAPYLSAGYGFNACLDLAERAGGEYLGLYDLSQGAIVAGVERSLRQPRSA